MFVNPAVSKAHLQTLFGVELVLRQQQEDLRDLLLEMPAEDIMPMLGAALIYAAETLRDEYGDEGGLEHVANVRRQLGGLREVS